MVSFNNLGRKNIIKKYDIIIISIILLISLFPWLIYQYVNRNQNVRAEIYHFSKLVKMVDLEQEVDKKFSIDNKPNVVFHLFKDGSLCFEESDCPHQLCIRSGRLNRPGQFAACIPNGIIVKIVPGKDRLVDVDLVIGE